MLIPREERSKYTAFAEELSKELKSVSIPPNTRLWHYTNGSAVISILDSMSLYSTHISCLNDSSELRYASKLFREALAKLIPKISSNPASHAFLKRAINYFAEDPTTPAQISAHQFVACFSTEKDDLSQWRAYGGGENGYAIGFNAGDLWGSKYSMLARISYDPSLHTRLAHEAAERMVQFFQEGIVKCDPSDHAQWEEEFLQAWELTLTLVAPLVKDPAFIKENECRIVKSISSDELIDLKFLQRSNMMSRHLPLRPPMRTPSTPYRLPIAEIIIGPCRHPQVSRLSVDTLLQQKGYTGVPVSISKIPFQTT